MRLTIEEEKQLKKNREALVAEFRDISLQILSTPRGAERNPLRSRRDELNKLIRKITLELRDFDDPNLARL